MKLPRAPTVVSPGGPVLFPTERPRRICLVLLSGLGDVVHGLPLAWDVKGLDPSAEVVWIAEPAPARLLDHHPAVDRIVVYRRGAGLAGLAELRRALAGLRAGLAVNAQRYLKSVWPTLLSGAPRRIGLPPSKTRDAIRFAHTHVLAETDWKHTQDLFLDFRWALGADRGAPPRWEIALSDEELAEQRAFFERLDDRPVAALVPASANPEKDWPPARYARLADALSADFGFRVVLVGGRSDRERAAVAEILARAGPGPLDCTADSVRRLVWLLDGAELVVAPDTGPLHVAHALDVPVIGLYGHTNPWRVGPYARFHDLVVDRYTDDGAPPDPSAYRPRMGGMERIAVNDVLARVEVARSRCP